ncbi:MAG TPA: cytochrome C oxidase subunit IV family protein [Ferruginibacter sp.]|nr:cytochrome C oxidase subunit IV family protein [Ferruginibacter sp.]
MSEHTPISPEITFVPEHPEDTKKIWKTFFLLSFLTIVELTFGLIIYNIKLGGEEARPSLVLAFKGMVCILTLAKAYYIVSVFMHLGEEVRNLIMTIVVPLCLFIWFITAFLVDGNSWKELRNRYNRPADAPTEQVAPVKE